MNQISYASSSLAPIHKISSLDNVAIATRRLVPGEVVSIGKAAITVASEIPMGHKIAVQGIEQGENVIKYGWPIGRASAPIAPGTHVHSHNLATSLTGKLSFSKVRAAQIIAPKASSHVFEGYRRASGRVGTRNEIWILPTVGCVNRTCERIATAARVAHADVLDGIHAVSHPFGCSQLGNDLDSTRSILASLASHPNAGGVLIVGLGCESNQLQKLVSSIDPAQLGRVRTLSSQASEDELREGLAAVAELVAIAAEDRREQCKLEDLVIGLKCGGSDAFSGVTANPLVGQLADRVTQSGGTAVLTELPEIFGAEQVLLSRSANDEVLDSAARLLQGFRDYFTEQGFPVYENPSPGNIAGGITTLEEKSLGAVQKAGRATLTEVLHYGERVSRRGLVLLEAPGNDATSSTALTAAGATVILFTTGRGTPLGFPAPTLKISSNSDLAFRKPNWIDFDAGVALRQGTAEGQNLTDSLLALVTATASGKLTCAERAGEREIAIWKRGITL